jgi:diketogulonate reductase-like aldo/keto reductase
MLIHWPAKSGIKKYMAPLSHISVVFTRGFFFVFCFLVFGFFLFFVFFKLGNQMNMQLVEKKLGGPLKIYTIKVPLIFHIVEESAFLYLSGKCKAIGVSNYTIDHLEQMKSYLYLCW